MPTRVEKSFNAKKRHLYEEPALAIKGSKTTPQKKKQPKKKPAPRGTDENINSLFQNKGGNNGHDAIEGKDEFINRADISTQTHYTFLFLQERKGR